MFINPITHCTGQILMVVRYVKGLEYDRLPNSSDLLDNNQYIFRHGIQRKLDIMVSTTSLDPNSCLGNNTFPTLLHMLLRFTPQSNSQMDLGALKGNLGICVVSRRPQSVICSVISFPELICPIIIHILQSQ